LHDISVHGIVVGVAASITRRRALRLGVGGLATVLGGGALAVELVDHGVLPGKRLLDTIDGACDVPMPPVTFGAPGPQRSGSFHSRARGRVVGYTIAYPPGHGPGSRLPLIIALHANDGNHAHAFSGGTAAHALAMRVGGTPLPPVAVAAADGGDGYWHRHGRDDPMRMLIDELVPLCRAAGLGRRPHRIGATGISMGGYGALLLAERHPETIAAVSAISPAVWTSYAQARVANAYAFSSARDFATHDVIAGAARLRHVAVRVAAATGDPFYPGVRALARALPPGATTHFSSGCHTSPFFDSQEPPSLAFLAAKLSPTGSR
jgi:enterochelin esterase-like enzyme